MSNRYFYGRVSSKDQNLARQLESARQYKDIDGVFTDKQSGKNFDRSGYLEMKNVLPCLKQLLQQLLVLNMVLLLLHHILIY